MKARATVTATRGASATVERAADVVGVAREDDRYWIDVDDRALEWLQSLGGRVLVDDDHGSSTSGELRHDGRGIAVHLDSRLDDGIRNVRVRPRGVRQ